MAFRNIVIESPATVSMKNKQLLIQTEELHSVAIEDISALLLENRQITITTATLSYLGQCGCAVFCCDEKHLPCAVLTPYMQHSRQLQTIQAQLALTVPQKKQLWKSIIQAKIQNQALCLQLTGKSAESAHLQAMVSRVRSGDSENVEATAAQFYFPALFGQGFTRSDETGINAGLNYGYAILRGCIARTLAVYGFLPAMGLHHHSSLNAFNLADDCIEPFRPVVDLLVYHSLREEDELTTSIKRQLFNIMNLDILSGQQHHSVAYAIERMIQSLLRAMEDSKNALLLPKLLELKQHRYE